MSSFEIVALPEEVATAVRREQKDAFGNHDLRPVTVDKAAAYPCRVCMEDARPGESVLLFSYSPFEKAAPHQTLGPVFVHAHACTPFARGARVPEMLERRLLALRAYDTTGSELVACELVDGAALEARAREMLADPRVARVNVHFARAGCFACTIERSAR